MEIYTVSFFGHRKIDNALQIETKLEEIITNLIQTKEYVEFLVGREGEFDILASSVVKKVKEQNDYGNCSLILVLPYMKAEFRNNEKSFLEYYDDIEICHAKSGYSIYAISFLTFPCPTYFFLMEQRNSGPICQAPIIISVLMLLFY